MLLERLPKEIAEELPMEEDLEGWCEFLRDGADDKGKGNDSDDQVPGSSTGACRTQYRREDASVSPSQGMVSAAVTHSLKKENVTVSDAIKSSHGQGVDEDAECMRHREIK